MRNSLDGSIKELKEILDKAKQDGICLNRNYPENCSEKELHDKINLASMDVMFSYTRRFKNSQEDFESSFDVIKVFN